MLGVFSKHREHLIGSRKGAGIFLLLFLFLIPSGLMAQEKVKKAKPSVKRGLYEQSFDVELTSATPGATIRFTLDGSAPTRSRGTRYVEPLRIRNTTMLRMMAYKAGMQDSKVTTHTYIFLDDVLSQSENQPGYPNWSIDGALDPRGYRLDYEMDPSVVNSGSYRNMIRQALQDIPSLSIVMNKDDMFGNSSGIYRKGGDGHNRNHEKPASIELIYPGEPDEGFHINAGIRPHSHINLKRSFKLLFKSEYGEANLDYPFFEKAALNSETAVEKFDQLVLRAGTNRSIVGYMPENQKKAVYIRDEWARQTQIEMSGVGSHGLFVHLYINGFYWGVYNAVERPDDHFASEYLGGNAEDWFAGNHGGDVGGNDDRWDYLRNTLSYRDLRNASYFNQAKDHIDFTSFADYVLQYFYNGGGDWQESASENNFYYANRNSPPGPIRFFVWDAESSWFDSAPAPMRRPGRSHDDAWIKPQFLTPSEGSPHPFTRDRNTIARIFRALMRNDEFRLLFADRVYKHLYHGGALTDQASRERWSTLANRIEGAIVAEFARWGDGKTPDSNTGVSSRFDRNAHWYGARDEVLQKMQGNANRLIRLLRNQTMEGQKMYPSFDPPQFSRQGGRVPAGFDLTMSRPQGNGTIYYSTDGSDPRSGGTVYSGAVPIRGTATIKARIKNGSKWSALNEATFYGEQDWSGLVINEIMYNPASEGFIGGDDFVDGDEFEFLELYNAGNHSLDLGLIQFTEGIEFTFEEGTMMEAGTFIVLAENPELFESRYGFAPFGKFAGKLSNAGEELQLADGSGRVIDEVEYDDEDPWPTGSDGSGRSLVLIDPGLDNSQASAWRDSREEGGSPGDGNVSNTSPEITMVSPTDGGRIEPGDPVPFRINASDPDPDGRVEKVTFYAGPIELGEDDSSPFDMDFDLAVGTYSVRAIATDNLGAQTATPWADIRVEAAQACTPDTPGIVITEINYNPPDDLAAGDWVELYNPSNANVDLSGWVLKDEVNTNAITFANGTGIPPMEYLVIVRDSALFSTVHPDVTNYTGQFNFNLSTGDDTVWLYSPSGCAVDAVNYEDSTPWPSEPDGTGATLELIDPELDNAEAENWGASPQYGGTPGQPNAFGSPLIRLLSPADGARFGRNENITFSIFATDNEPTVNVEVFADKQSLGIAESQGDDRYRLIWPSVAPGTYEIYVVGSDSDGRQTQSPTITITVSQAIGLISSGSSWRYHDGGQDLGTDWRSASYNDSSWDEGEAQLGYGDDDEATVLSFGSDPNNKNPTVYFRKRFNVNNVAQFVGLTVHLLRDDGAVVYINGREVVRSNMPDGEISYRTYAASAVAVPEESIYFSYPFKLVVYPGLLVEGENVIAVEVHQRERGSSDISFDLALEGNVPGVYANVQALLQGSYIGQGAMGAWLNELELLPLAHPYAAAPWKYGGAEAVEALPHEHIVDWVLMELRTAPEATSTVAQKAAFITAEGKVVDLDGESMVPFEGLEPGAYYLVLRHRNHLGVMSAEPVPLAADSSTALYNFSEAGGRAYQDDQAPMVKMIDGFYALVGGDASGDGILVRYDGPQNDREALVTALGGNIGSIQFGYNNGDLNMDGLVRYNGPRNDRTLILRATGGPELVRRSQVPQ